MKLRVAWIGKTRQKPLQALTDEYVARLARYTSVEPLELSSEAALAKQIERPDQYPVLLDSRGEQLSSEELAEFLRIHQDRGTHALLFAVGGANGFSESVRKTAKVQLSLGRMTLPHELARVVLLEQLYRGYTILKGHPYHLGH